MAILQRNNMNVYLPYVKLTTVWMVNSGIGGLNLYSTLLSQNNISIYNDSLDKNVLDSSQAVDVFNWWTDMYTKYGIAAEQDFYNRFRIGVTPLGIDTYTTYTTFSQTAPEIEGKWGIAMIPGTVQEDGSLKRSTSGSGSGCLILNTSEHKEKAWEFLKWWTREDTQLRYSKNVESLLGSVGRVATSNVNAFSNYSWRTGDRDILLEQWSQVEEVPEVPGSYYLSRAVDQAFWETINKNNTASDALLRWSSTANDEITRKIKEYSE
jgi:ABC-type glycerol-3-phosphate transport system substrate-binding protein